MPGKFWNEKQETRAFAFPKTRMVKALERLKCQIKTAEGDLYPSVYREGDNVPKAYYFRHFGQYYPRFILHHYDSEIRRAVEPYVIFW